MKDEKTKTDRSDSEGQFETVVSNAKRRKLFLPICKVHHITFSYGFVLLPIFKWTIGIFEFGGNYWETGNWKPKWGVKVVCKNKFHNCTWTGRY